MVKITLKNVSSGLNIIFKSNNINTHVGIVNVKTRRIDEILLSKLLSMDLNCIGIYYPSIMVEIFEKIKKIVSNLYLKKKWTVSFNKDIQ